MTLPEAYCLFNRARGAQLASPEDTLAAARRWAALPPDAVAGLRLRALPSGVLAVEAGDDGTPLPVGAGGCASGGAASGGPHVTLRAHARAAHPAGGLSAAAAAAALGCSPLLAAERLLRAEAAGALCRDDAPDGARFYDWEPGEWGAGALPGGGTAVGV